MPETNWFTEAKGDILDRFSLYLNGAYRSLDSNPPDDFYLVHTISGDNAQGAGFARLLNMRYKFRQALCADFAESFPGFGTDNWMFDKNQGDFFRVTRDRKFQRMRFAGSIGDIYETHRAPHILGLVTKEHYYDKPSLDDMRKALRALHDYFYNKYYLFDDDDTAPTTELMMPRIGCGLDKLNWDDVKQIIFEELQDLAESGWIKVVAVEYPKYWEKGLVQW